MKRKLLMPKLGLTMTEGVIAEWSIEVGAAFKADDTLFVVETDKVANEIPAEAAGVLSEIVATVGQTVAVGEVIGYWDDGVADAGAEDGAADVSSPISAGTGDTNCSIAYAGSTSGCKLCRAGSPRALLADGAASRRHRKRRSGGRDRHRPAQCGSGAGCAGITWMRARRRLRW